MSILSRVLYKKYGVIISEAEASYFNFIIGKNKSLKHSLLEFSKNCDTRYFCKKRVDEIAKSILKEEIGRDMHTPKGKGASPDGKGPAGNITDQQIISIEDGLYIEDSVDTASGKEAVYLEDENENKMYKEMEDEYVPIFARNIKNNRINN